MALWFGVGNWYKYRTATCNWNWLVFTKVLFVFVVEWLCVVLLIV